MSRGTAIALLDRPDGGDQHGGDSTGLFERTESDVPMEPWLCKLVGEILAAELRADASTDVC
jgi:hypothetical protein